MKWLVLVVLAACGDNLAAPIDAAPIATCAATFTGNFAEVSSTTDNCPVFRSGGLVAADLSLDVEIAVATVGTSIGITIDLGATPTPGVFSSETTQEWSALAVAHVASGACIYNAGTTAIPVGSFLLSLDSLDGATGHGTLEVIQYVLRYVNEQGQESECGEGDTEQLELVF